MMNVLEKQVSSQTYGVAPPEKIDEIDSKHDISNQNYSSSMSMKYMKRKSKGD